VGHGELEVLGEELLDVGAADIGGLLDLNDLEDLFGNDRQRTTQRVGVAGITHMDGPEAAAVAGSHVLVKGVDSIRSGKLAVLFVHVVGTGTGIVTDPDTEVLDLGGALLVNLRRAVLASVVDAIARIRCIRTTWRETISPALFLTFRSFFKKYQKRDLATTTLGAKSFIL
jgi:hypothetical protein